MPDEVVSWSKASGDSASPLKSRINDGSAPISASERRRRHAHLVDLEPVTALSIAGIKGTIAWVHPDHYGALLMRPLGPDGSDVFASGDVGAERGAGSAVASHCRV